MKTCACWAPVQAQGAPAVGKEKCVSSPTVELRDFLNLEGKLGLDTMVLWEEQQKQKCAFERNVKGMKAEPARKEAQPTVSEISAIVFDNESNVDLDLHAVVRWKTGQSTADSGEVFKAAGATPTDTIAVRNSQGSKIITKAQDLCVAGKGGLSDALSNFMHGTQNYNAA